MTSIVRETAAEWEPVVEWAGDRPYRHVDPRDLLNGTIPLVVLRGFLNDDALDAANVAIDLYRDTAEVRRFPNGTLTTIGPWLLKYLDDLDPYFATARTTEDVLTSGGAGDPGRAVRRAIQELFGLRRVRVPLGPGGQPYADKVIRIHAPGVDNPLHNDKVGRDTRELAQLDIRRVTRQLSAVLSVQECNGGVLTIWRKCWEPADEAFKLRGALGYDSGVVRGCASIDFHPRAGDLYLFCPEHYHAISRVEPGPERRTIGQFVGFIDEHRLDEALVWA
jgi:hypothetical protein